ncbi:MAG: GAF domain-containing protein [Synechococcales cyanobacterium M58_A2018_015]|nr:GAF domain-containing protein [Synechococcales cyanobacterium M58_A2018_015]
MLNTLPADLETVFTAECEPEARFAALLPVLCRVLHTDRCFLQVRHPERRLYRIFCWRRRDDIPDLTTDGWQPEDPWEEDDPMFAAALSAAPSIFVADIETAGAEVLNLEFERQFGHRALVHGHICADGVLYGILQPCLFDQPRVWSEDDRAMVAAVIERVKPVVMDYSKTASH